MILLQGFLFSVSSLSFDGAFARCAPSLFFYAEEASHVCVGHAG
jgi:hypothetical protein